VDKQLDAHPRLRANVAAQRRSVCPRRSCTRVSRIRCSMISIDTNRRRRRTLPKEVLPSRQAVSALLASRFQPQAIFPFGDDNAQRSVWTSPPRDCTRHARASATPGLSTAGPRRAWRGAWRPRVTGAPSKVSPTVDNPRDGCLTRARASPSSNGQTRNAGKMQGLDNNAHRRGCAGCEFVRDRTGGT
jgi:hypothetical protein